MRLMGKLNNKTPGGPYDGLRYETMDNKLTGETCAMQTGRMP